MGTERYLVPEGVDVGAHVFLLDDNAKIIANYCKDNEKLLKIKELGIGCNVWLANLRSTVLLDIFLPFL